MLRTNELQSVYEADRKLQRYEKCLTEIREIARVNSVNTCWSVMNLCADCDDKKDCGLQCYLEKIKQILNKTNEVLDDMEHNQL